MKIVDNAIDGMPGIVCDQTPIGGPICKKTLDEFPLPEMTKQRIREENDKWLGDYSGSIVASLIDIAGRDQESDMRLREEQLSKEGKTSTWWKITHPDGFEAQMEIPDGDPNAQSKLAQFVMDANTEKWYWIRIEASTHHFPRIVNYRPKKV